MAILTIGRRKMSDTEVVDGLQRQDRRTEEWFYHAAQSYFNAHFNTIFFDKDRKQEIFQTAFMKIWMEIRDKKIQVHGDAMVRQQRNGEYKTMTCSLTTFLIAYARTEYRELVRNTREDYYDELFEDSESMSEVSVAFQDEEDIEEQKNRIVDECIQMLPPRCTEVLTLFYYEGRSLDEIMAIRGDKNTSKNGLKSAKNKCMNTLRERITEEFRRYKIA